MYHHSSIYWQSTYYASIYIDGFFFSLFLPQRQPSKSDVSEKSHSDQRIEKKARRIGRGKLWFEHCLCFGVSQKH